ncbi:amidohydrolase family protein [Streptomyces sp. NPDC000880]
MFAKGRPILFRGATVVSMDARLGVLPAADVLVLGNKISAVGPDLEAPPGAAIIDAAGGILLPGLINTHQHLWQTSLRGVGAEWTITNYLYWLGGSAEFKPIYRPDDVYAGNYLAMAEAVYSGVTTVLDWSDGTFTPAHADAAADALFDSGARARMAYGGWGSNAAPDLSDVDRIRRERFSSTDQLVTLQIGIDQNNGDPAFPSRAAWEFARDRELIVTGHAGLYGVAADNALKAMHAGGFTLPTNTYVHAGSFTDESYRIIAETGGNISISAESELNAGQGYPAIAKAREYGIQYSMSGDTSAWWSGDMFNSMRAAINTTRGLAHQQERAAGVPIANNALRTDDVLYAATMGGAHALGMADSLGSITPGKLADLVLVSGNSPVLYPVNDPIATLVFQAGRGEVDTVLVNGRVLKYRGEPLGMHLDRARALAENSRDHLRAAIGEQSWLQAMNPPLPG